MVKLFPTRGACGLGCKILCNVLIEFLQRRVYLKYFTAIRGGWCVTAGGDGLTKHSDI